MMTADDTGKDIWILARADSVSSVMEAWLEACSSTFELKIEEGLRFG